MAKNLDLKINVDTQEAQNSLGKFTDAADAASGGLISKMKGLYSSLLTVAGGFKSVGVAVAASGLGLVVVALAGIAQAFKRTEEGQNKFAKIMAVIGSVTENLLDLLGDVGELLISTFENPQQALKDFGNLIKDNFINRFNGLIELIPKLGQSIELLFKGKFSESAKVAVDAVGKVTLGVNSVTDSLNSAVNAAKRLGEELLIDAEIAGKIADKRAKADRLERDLIVEKAKAERDRADLLEKAQRRDEFTISERIKLLEEASAISEAISLKEINVARLRMEAKIEENKLSDSNLDALKEEEELKAALINIEAARLRQQKEVTGQIQALKAQEPVLDANFRAQIIDGTESLEGEKKDIIKRSNKLTSEEALALLKIDMAKSIEIEKQKQDAITANAIASARQASDIIAGFGDLSYNIELQKIKEIDKAKRQSSDSYYNEQLKKVEQGSEEEKKILERQKQDNYVIEENYRKKQEAILEKQWKFNKKLQLSAAIIDGAKAITSSLAQSPVAIGPVPNPAGIASLALAASTTALNIAKIASSKYDTGGGSVSAPNVSIPEFNPQQNNVNVSNINQVQAPVQAYISATDVSNALEARKMINDKNKL